VRVEERKVIVKGPQGELVHEVSHDMAVELREKEISVHPMRAFRGDAALWGLSRSIIANMVEGASRGFAKKLEFEGIGFRASLEGETLVMQLGFSHPVRFRAPEGVGLKVEKSTITVTGSDKEIVGEVAARIRALKLPEPYKGKGIKYQGEVIRRKAGKKATTSA